MKPKQNLIKLLITTVFVIGGFDAYAESAGSIVRATGTVNATDAAGKSRALSSGAALNVGESVTAGQKSAVQIQMKDASILAITADSALKVDAYDAQKMSLTLQKGHSKVVTGSTPQAGYSFKTPTAVVRLHGTSSATFDVQVSADGKSTSVILRGGAIVAEATCDGAASGRQQVVDVPDMAVELVACMPPKTTLAPTEIGRSVAPKLPPPPPPPPSP